MLTTRQNFIETITGRKPDRFVNQYEFVETIMDPICDGAGGGCPEGGTRVNDWGVHIIYPEGFPGPFPLEDPSVRVCKDITKWRDTVHASDPNGYTDEQWDPILEVVDKIDRKEKFVAPFFHNGVFEKLHFLMGMEETMCNFYEEPEEMEALIKYIADWEIEAANVIAKKYHPDILFQHDDWGSQLSTFMSPAMFEEFLLPAYKRIYGHWKNNCGIKYIVHHSDSYAATFVPFMIDMGIDVWQGAVEENNLPELVKKYGGQITLMCGLDNGKYDRPDWSRESIRAGLDKFFKGCGTKYIIPCFTMGGPGSTFPGAYDCATELIDEFSEQYFGNKIDFTRTLTGTFSHHKAEEQYGDK